jgi:single-strand DNA-binding protein
MYEQTVIVGNLGSDPVMRYLPSGDAVTNFSVAVNARWTGADGTPGERTTWYQVTCWGRLAEATNQYLTKGRKVMVTARRIQAEAYLDKDGKPKAALKLTADAVKFLDSTAGERSVGEAAEIPF